MTVRDNILTISPDQISAGLKTLRQISELSQSVCAERSGITAAFISQIESKQRSINYFTLRNYLSVFNYSVGQFYSSILFDKSDNYKDTIIELWSSKDKKNRLLLNKPIFEHNDIEDIELILQPKRQFNKDALSIESQIICSVEQGQLLIHFNDDEQTVKAGEIYKFDGSKMFYLRNYQPTLLKANLLIAPANF